MKNRTLRIISLITILILLGSINIFPQSYLTHTYNVDDGLPSSHVYDAEQDSAQHMWFATSAGIVSFDGYTWKTYYISESESNYPLYKLECDDDGVLWAALYNEKLQLLYFDGEDWIVSSTSDHNVIDQSVTCFRIIKTVNGNVFFIGTEGEGLFVYHDSEWNRITEDEGLPCNCINGIERYNQKILIATSRGLREFKEGSIVDHWSGSHGLDDNYIWGLYYHYQSDKLWIVDDRKIGFMSNDTFHYVTENQGPDKNIRRYFWYKLMVDPYDGLYYGNPYAIYYYNSHSGKTIRLGRSNGLITEGLTSIFIDAEKNVWITSLRGISKIVSMRFENYTQKHGLFNNEVSTMVEVEPDYFAIGHSKGITILKSGIMTPVKFESCCELTDVETRVLDMTVDNAKNIWFAASNLGLGRIDKDMNIRWYHRKNESGSDRYSSVVCSSDGTIRVSIASKIYVLKKDFLVEDEEFNWYKSENLIRKLVPGKNRSLYILTTGSGFIAYNENSIKGYSLPGYSKKNSVFAVHEYGEDLLLVGTLDGLYKTQGDSLIRFEQDNFRIDRPVYSILSDKGGRLWFGTSRGVIRWDGVKSKEFTESQGFAGNEVNRSATLMDQCGNLWFGTETGVSCYQEHFDLMSEDITPPRITLDYVIAGRDTFSLEKDLTFKYNQNSIVFRIGVVSFIDDKQTDCFVKLEGIDDQWIRLPANEHNDIRYIQVPPGKYRFHARAENVFNVWSPMVSSGFINIRKPFWYRWWFILSATILLMFIGGITFRGITYQRYNKKLIQRVDERTRQLQLSESRYRQIFENNRSIMLILDPDTGKIIDANPSACEFYGYTIERMKTCHYFEFCVNSSNDKLYSFPVSVDNNFLNFMSRHRLASGDIKDVEIFASRLLLEEDIRIYIIIHDITEKKQIEQELLRINQLETIGILSGGIAHDFNNILTAIMGYVSTAKLEVKEIMIADALKKTLRACARAKDLTRQLLIFSKEGVPSKELTSSTNFIKESVQFIMRGTNVSCELDIQEKLWNIEIDRSQITQVMNNIIMNAIQAMPRGGNMKISVKNYEVGKNTSIPLNAGNYIKVDIEDQGEGIAEEDLHKIFNPYYTTKKAGSGLGLTISHSIISRHGGLIMVNSKLGQGTAFTIYLPASPEKYIHASVWERVITNGEGKILVMDDKEEIRDVAKEMLLKLGYEVECAVEGREAIGLYQDAFYTNRPFHAVIIDLTIQGGLGGIETMQALLEIDPNVKAIMSTGYYHDPVTKNYTRYGFKGFLAKPYDIENLSHILNEVLSN
ncbi:response regulator [candidate division KSB1 bacterium]|nr:response regulator [candidate division KSB1 bacterium]